MIDIKLIKNATFRFHTNILFFLFQTPVPLMIKFSRSVENAAKRFRIRGLKITMVTAGVCKQ